jgi:hypothetical protein
VAGWIACPRHCDTAAQRSPVASNLALNVTYLARCSKSTQTGAPISGRDIGPQLREVMEMAITRTLGAIPHHGWVALVKLVLVVNVVVASFAWWLVGLI